MFFQLNIGWKFSKKICQFIYKNPNLLNTWWKFLISCEKLQGVSINNFLKFFISLISLIQKIFLQFFLRYIIYGRYHSQMALNFCEEVLELQFNSNKFSSDIFCAKKNLFSRCQNFRVIRCTILIFLAFTNFSSDI
jgi:hypothetical protein